ncbi:hypothetical protein D1B31_17955 [Neobacillus notoginsengisoli]|uniref:Lipoprotein n=1 Tax=Neobacillus notoginsengisoli TaxID=1578198 RepID=A0A417YQB2_9BACI|nr:hypothetical protein [Neobacillus notoginsengisoli]RHW35973.1 hypothetical protein D1B31_17955 [Neobacillus notoginsengisoli]
MKNHLPIMLLIILLLVSCRSKENNLISEGEGEETHSTTNANISIDNSLKTNQQKDLNLHIEMPNQEPLYVSLETVPILSTYLEQFEDKKNEINRIRSSYLYTNNQKDYFLVNYSCGTKLCNQLLLEHNQGDIQSLQISESSFLQNSKLNNDYLAFLFGRNEGSEVLRNQVVIINIKNFQKISPPEDLKVLESFKYPIPFIEWRDGTLISTIADIDDTSYERIKEWYKNNQEPFQQLKWKIL